MYERWEATTHDPSGGSSMNHIMYGGMQSWYFTHLIGLTKAAGVAGAGYKSIRVAPQVPTAGSSLVDGVNEEAAAAPGLAGAALQLAAEAATSRWRRGCARAALPPLDRRKSTARTPPALPSQQAVSACFEDTRRVYVRRGR